MTPPPTHLQAASIAAVVYRVPVAVLLAIAEHETHFAQLRNGRACGAMQAVTPLACAAIDSELVSYLEGARVLRAWLDRSKDMRTALQHYACGNVADYPDCRGFARWVVRHAKQYEREAES